MEEYDWLGTDLSLPYEIEKARKGFACVCGIEDEALLPSSQADSFGCLRGNNAVGRSQEGIVDRDVALSDYIPHFQQLLCIPSDSKNPRALRVLVASDTNALHLDLIVL